MKSLKHLNRHLAPFSKLSKTKIQLLGFCFLFVTVLVSIFFITRGSIPHISELAYIEHSILGKEAGSMIPASCNSAPPTSHFNGDCVATCPGGVGTYDPTFDPTMLTCPAPVVTMSIAPGIVDYGGGYSSLTLTSSGANACYLNYQWAGSPEASAGAAPLNYVWGASGALSTTLSYRAYCYNGPNYTFSNWATIYVKPSIPSSPQAVCNNAQGTSATLSWGASLNADLGYYLRIEYPAAQSCPLGWQRGGSFGNTCFPNPDTFVPTTYTFTTNPDQSYPWWVHGRNSYVYSDAVGTTFTCNQPAASLTLSQPSCEIPTGSGSCTVNASWNTANPYNGNVTTLSRDKPSRTDYTQNVGTNVPVTVYGPPATSLTTLTLANAGVTMDTETVSATCEPGASWDTLNSVCADPTVFSAVITDQHYPPGDIRLTCLNSTSYSVERNGLPFIAETAYPVPGPVVRNDVVLSDGNYTIKCIHGSVSDQAAILYNATPGPTEITLTTSVTEVDPPATTTLTWDVTYPSNSCTLSASVVCANNACTIDQLAASTTINAILSSANTDLNDPNTSRPILNAIQTPAPGHKDSDIPVISADYKALGKKTIPIKYTTDITYSCNGVKETKRIRVTKSEEQ